MQINISGKSIWLNYHHLYYFKVIATEGSILAASKKLRIGQPALSTQLKQFENSLQVQLFNRSHKRLTLTEIGKVVQQYANEIFRIGGEMLEAMHDQHLPSRTHVQIGVLDSVPKHLVLEIAKDALRNQSCAISILEGKPDELLRELTNHSIDIIVSNFVPTLLDATGLYSRKIGTAPVLICGSAKYKSLRKGFPESLHQKPFVMPTTHSKLRHDVDHYMRLSGIHPNVIVETQDTAIQKLMGIDGIGLIPAPLPAVSEYIKSKQLFVVGQLDGVKEDLFMVAASRKLENPVSSYLMKTFQLKL